MYKCCHTCSISYVNYLSECIIPRTREQVCLLDMCLVLRLPQTYWIFPVTCLFRLPVMRTTSGEVFHEQKNIISVLQTTDLFQYEAHKIYKLPSMHQELVNNFLCSLNTFDITDFQNFVEVFSTIRFPIWLSFLVNWLLNSSEQILYVYSGTNKRFH